QMENVQGGDLLDGACAALGGVGAGMAVRTAMGISMLIPAWGQAVLAAGAVACLGRAWDIW
ncbi:MAG: hypothetical protein Q4A09_03475, partial [Capnocytophaga felis]|nr:hypothetical protein [Capnocytophaga felis]